MSENKDDTFKGGGTSIKNLKQQPLPPQLPPPQHQQQMPHPSQAYQQQQMMYYQQQMPHPSQAYQQAHPSQCRNGDQKPDKIKIAGDNIFSKIENMFNGQLLKESIIVSIIFFIMSKKSVFKMQNIFLPEQYMIFDNPKFFNMFVQSVVTGVLFYIVMKFLV